MRSTLAEARNDNASPREGELIAGRYRVEGVIGTGGMGRVVAARDEAGKAVAIKLLLSPPSERVWVERFFREARTVSRINSNHVVKLLAVSSPKEETPFIVMERLRGRDFGKRLRAEGPLTLKDVADCIVQACDAIACSHNAGVVHRDVKPSNLFDHANPDGTHTLKVLDFGISKARGQEEFEHTLTTSRDGMLGSPPYMSPEHIRDARSVDHRTDIWSLGVVAYQLLAGRLPFDGQSVGEVFCSVLERRFTPLSKIRPDLPREIEQIINKCLAREPGERYQIAAELAKAFADYATPHIAALVPRMPTTVPEPASGPGAPRGGLVALPSDRLDGELHTLTLPPVVSGDSAPAPHDDAEPTEPNIIPVVEGMDPVITIPAVPKLLPYEDLSAASIAAAKRRPKRSLALAAGVAILMFGLMALPFVFSGSSNSAKATPTNTSVPTLAPPALVENAATTAAPAPIAKPATPTDTPADVTFTVPSERAKSALTSPPALPATKSTTKTASRVKAITPPKVHTPPPPPTQTEPKAAKPPEPKAPEKPPSELHPNPYDSF